MKAAQRLARAETARAEEAEKHATDQKEAALKLRRRAIAAGGAAVVALFLLAISVIMWHKSELAGAAAEEQTRAAQSSERNAQLQLAKSLIAQGDALGLASQWGQAKERYIGASDLLSTLKSDTFPAQLDCGMHMDIRRLSCCP